jgi:hypothetical protein
MQNIEEFCFVSIVKRGHLLLPHFDPCFNKFSEKFKNSEKHWKSKKYVFNTFASFFYRF